MTGALRVNGVPLDTILRAGYWHLENSFVRFYLRDTAGLNEKLFSLGPNVAAQKVINSGLTQFMQVVHNDNFTTMYYQPIIFQFFCVMSQYGFPGKYSFCFGYLFPDISPFSAGITLVVHLGYSF